MKKNTMLIIAGLLLAGSTYADMWGAKRGPESIGRRVSRSETNTVAQSTIVEYAAEIADYLGPRAGVFYDFGQGELCAYVGGTIYTYDAWATSLNIGVLDSDGAVVSVDYNVGAVIPADDVPILNLTEYLYLGAGAGGRYLEDDSGVSEWEAAYGLDIQFKLTW